MAFFERFLAPLVRVGLGHGYRMLNVRRGCQSKAGNHDVFTVTGDVDDVARRVILVNLLIVNNQRNLQRCNAGK
jgi:hypothetical protein